MAKELNLKEIAAEIFALIHSTQKEILTTEEAASYMGIVKSYLYKLTMERKIPYYKPSGKLMYFKRAELDNWLLSNRISTEKELQDQANRMTQKGGAA